MIKMIAFVLFVVCAAASIWHKCKNDNGNAIYLGLWAIINFIAYYNI